MNSLTLFDTQPMQWQGETIYGRTYNLPDGVQAVVGYSKAGVNLFHRLQLPGGLVARKKWVGHGQVDSFVHTVAVAPLKYQATWDGAGRLKQEEFRAEGEAPLLLDYLRYYNGAHLELTQADGEKTRYMKRPNIDGATADEVLKVASNAQATMAAKPTEGVAIISDGIQTDMLVHTANGTSYTLRFNEAARQVNMRTSGNKPWQVLDPVPRP